MFKQTVLYICKIEEYFFSLKIAKKKNQNFKKVSALNFSCKMFLHFLYYTQDETER